jgi:hypothetical protein
MPDGLRITVDEVRKRMEAGEDVVLINTRNPQAWSQSDVKLRRLFGFLWRTLTKAFPRFLRTSPLSRTAPDRTSTLAPIWRKTSRRVEARMLEHFKMVSMRGTMWVCR